MKVTWNWLAEFVEMTLPVGELAGRLAMAGFEVEAVEERGRELSGVVCAELVRVSAHPQAERLSICDVRTGDDTIVSVVCGAPNLRAGDRVAYAPPGVTLPDGRRIASAEIRGVHSVGMLCAESELGVGPDASGILVLPNEAAIGAGVAAILGVEDTVLDIAVTPNRGDCLSILGMAREIAALTGQRLRRRRLSATEGKEAAADLIAVHIADPDLCGRYVARVVLDVSVLPSPLWMQSRLQAIGMRPINNVVDVTNYVMIERGQPLHAFDYDRLPHPEIVVRRAGQESSFVTLDGQTRPLHPDDLLIASGEKPVAIAGVMGGADTEVVASTRRLLLESAWFAPPSVRRTSKRLDLHTEASYRFERCADVEGAAHAADRAASLIARLSGGHIARGHVDVYPGARPVAPISLRLKRVDDLLGMSLGRMDVASRLKALGMTVSPATRGTLTVVPPSFRADVSREIDLIEEIARLGGYENVPPTLPACTPTGAGVGSIQRRHRDLRRLLTGQGLHEAILLSFSSPRLNALFPGVPQRTAVRVRNPLTEDDAELRLSLCPGLIRAVRDNLARGAAHVALFSINKVFWRTDGFDEGYRVAGVLSRRLPLEGLGSRDNVAEFADLKGLVETVLDFFGMRDCRWLAAPDLAGFHPGKSARIEGAGTLVGVAGCLHPGAQEELQVPEPCWLFELDLERLLEYCPTRIVFKDLPRFPAVVRDLAVVAEDSFASDEVVHFVREWSKTAQWIEDIHLFDQYVGPPIPAGKKSLAYSISYRAPDRTLTDTEVNELHTRLTAAVQNALSLEPR